MFFALTILSFHGSSQSVVKLKRLAEEYADLGRFKEAAEYYQEAVSISPQDEILRFNLGLVLYRSLQYQKAENQFEHLAASSKTNKLSAQYWMGLMVKLTGQYGEADSIFNVLLANHETPPALAKLAHEEKEGCQLALKQQTRQDKYEIKGLDAFNSDYHDFGPVVDPKTGNLIIVTAREVNRKQFTDDKYGGFLPDLLSFKNNFAGGWANETDPSIDILNSSYAEGSGSFTKDGNKFYFTSCKAKNGSQCNIFLSERNNGSWSNPVSLDDKVNYPNSQVQHPYITQNGDTLFFASDRPGGEGGMDLWMSIKGFGETWSPAINLGEAINTSEDEIAPYFSSTLRALVFASKGHIGYGGYDFHIAKGISFFEPQIYNLGPPFNSSLDDVYLNIHGSIGFFASNRTESRTMNIYKFSIENEKVFFDGLMSADDLSDRRLIVARYRQMRSLALHTYRTDDFIGYEIYQPQVQKSEKLVDDSQFANIHGELDKPLASVKLVINDSLEILTKADQYGKFAFKLLVDSVHNLNDNYRFQSPASLLTHTIADTSGLFHERLYENIYFDFGDSKLREEGKAALSELVTDFDPRNIVLINIETHTDERGDHAFNFRLSEERGLTIVDFLAGLGVIPQKIRVVAHGETRPSNNNDTWYGRLFNRRAEITIYTREIVNYVKPEIFLVRKDLAIEKASELLGVEIDHLTKHNGAGQSVFAKGTVVRALKPQYFSINMRYLLEEKDVRKNFKSYVVSQGENLNQIGNKLNLPVELIMEMNQLKEVNPGDEIIVIQPDRSMKAPQL
ncbi:MAG: OmpA family protein [Cyclobacteriaceae bacterium]